MAGSGLTASLQDPVTRFAKALTVPRRLLALHPRKRGNSGDAAALAPAITLGVIAAFEGFVEEFFAAGAVSQGVGLAQVAKAVGNLNNPDVAAFESLVVGQLGVPQGQIAQGFSVDYWQPPAPGSTWWQEGTLNWADAKRDAEAWMQVRHLLTHGLTSGWRAEHWPGPLRKQARPASSVLRKTPTGRHTLVIHGAISCARIYVETSRHLAALTAKHLGVVVDVDLLPDFPLYKEEAEEQTLPPVTAESDEEADEPVEEGEETPHSA
jgi:hypothetical protein